MVKCFKYEDMIFPLINGVKKPICPDCVGHKQGKSMEVFDCKNMYYMDNKDGSKEVVGQCCCWSEEHGIRGDVKC